MCVQSERTHETWTSFILRRFVEAIVGLTYTGSCNNGFVCAPWRHYMFNFTETGAGLSEPTPSVYHTSSRSSCWVSLHAPVLLESTIIPFVLLTLTERLLSLLRFLGCLTPSQRCRQQKWWYDWTDVRRSSHGSAVFVMKGVATVWGLLISKSRTHKNAARRQCVTAVCVCVCVCVGALSRRSYQLLNHPSNYRGNRASITPSIIQGRQTERQNAARDVTAEWRDNKERGEGRRRRRRRGNEEEGHEEKKRRIFD